MANTRLLLRVARLSLVLLAACSALARAEVQCGGATLSIRDLETWAKAAAEPGRAFPRRFAPVAASGARARLSAFGARAAAPSSAVPQVEGAWQPGFGLPTLNEYPAAAIEYHGELIVGGFLRQAGTHPVSGIARWTGTDWAPLGAGVGDAFTLTILNDQLYAGDWLNQVSRWDGQSWTRLPPLTLDHLEALEVVGGQLVASGSLGPNGRVYRFDGTRWIQLGPDFNATVTALGSYVGELIAGGSFTSGGGATINGIARWDGAAWQPLGEGIDPAAYNGVGAIAEYGGKLIVGGWFNSCSRVATPGLAAWDGQSWSALPGVPPAYVEDLLVVNGRLYVAGGFGSDWSSVGSWDGANWRSEDLGQWTLALAPYAGGVAAAGGFASAGCPSPKTLFGAATLGASGWSALERWDDTMHGLAMNAGAGDARHMVEYRGELIVQGFFSHAGSPPGWKPFQSLARWTNGDWQAIPGAMPCPNTIAAIGNDLIAAGYYSGWSPEGALNGVGRWDGTNWHPMGSGVSGWPQVIAEFQGHVYMGGHFTLNATGLATTLAYFDGAEWQAVPGAPSAAQYNEVGVKALVPDGNLLFVGGNFTGPDGLSSQGVAAWDGAAWHDVGGGVAGDVAALQLYRGDLYAGGTMFNAYGSFAGGLSRWDGSAWHSMGLASYQVSALGIYGSRLVVGSLAGGDNVAPGSIGITAWDGTSWSGFGTGLSGFAESFCQVGGDLYVGGMFDRAGDQPSFGIARWGGNASQPDPITGPPPAGKPLAIRATVVSSNAATLRYALPVSGPARLDLYDVRGARIATLFDRVATAGESVFQWTPGAPAAFPRSGVYFLSLSQGGHRATAKLIIAR